MKKQKAVVLKKFTLISLIIGLSLLSSGCTRRKSTSTGPVGPSGKLEIFTWRSTEFKDLFREFAGEFMTKNKNVQIWYEQQPQENYEARSLKQIASDIKPQVWSIPVDWLPDHQDKLVPLPDSILGENINAADFMKSRILPGTKDNVWKSFIIDNKVYGIPFTIDSLILYYNPTLFEAAMKRWQQSHPRGADNKPSQEELRVQKLLNQAPRTWEELVAVTPLLTIRDGDEVKQSAIALGTADNVRNPDDIVQLMIYQNGGNIISDSGQKLAEFKDSAVKANGEVYFPGRQALELYTNFANPQKEIYTWNQSFEDSISAFANNQLAMLIDYPALREELNSEFPNFKSYRTSPMLQISLTETPINFGSYTVETVTKAAKEGKVEQSWAWILSYMKNPSSEKMTSTLKRPSPHRAITERRAQELNGVISKQALTVRVPYKVHHEEFDATFLLMIRNVSDFGQSVDSAINQANDKINELLIKADD